MSLPRHGVSTIITPRVYRDSGLLLPPSPSMTLDLLCRPTSPGGPSSALEVMSPRVSTVLPGPPFLGGRSEEVRGSKDDPEDHHLRSVGRESVEGPCLVHLSTSYLDLPTPEEWELGCDGRRSGRRGGRRTVVGGEREEDRVLLGWGLGVEVGPEVSEGWTSPSDDPTRRRKTLCQRRLRTDSPGGRFAEKSR